MEQGVGDAGIGSRDKGLYLSEVLTRNAENLGRDIVRIFKTMSSGHKIVLLTITKLVELVSDRTLILFDEPETHLHPPLLGSFIRSLSELLVARNGVAILATHSPVVLQEVPANCVSVLVRPGNVIRVARPDIETFAENVSALTSKVFGLEVEESGFFKLLSNRARGQDFEQVIEEFRGRIGGEGRALVRALTSEKKSE